jgi:hypothetical protein
MQTRTCASVPFEKCNEEINVILHLHRRYPQAENPPHIHKHLVFADTKSNPEKPKEYEFIQRSKIVDKIGGNSREENKMTKLI